MGTLQLAGSFGFKVKIENTRYIMNKPTQGIRVEYRMDSENMGFRFWQGKHLVFWFGTKLF